LIGKGKAHRQFIAITKFFKLCANTHPLQNKPGSTRSHVRKYLQLQNTFQNANNKSKTKINTINL